MKPAQCPIHGRRCLRNAGAPDLVACCISGTNYEPCRRCGGDEQVEVEEMRGAQFVGVLKPCPVCTDGWVVYPGVGHSTAVPL